METSTSIVYRPVRVDECEQVVGLHRAAFAFLEEAQHTIYASARIGRYLETLVAHPLWQDEHLLQGAWDGETLAGYAHFRALPASWHFNYMAIAPAYRKCGIGPELWEIYFQTGRQRGFTKGSLDVDEANPVRKSWRRRGFQTTKTTWTYRKQLEAKGAVEPGVRLLDWEDAQAWQQSYGFSRFRLNWAEREWIIRRIGESLFHADALLPNELETVLHALDPARLLLVSSPEPLDEANLQAAGISHHMERML